MIPYEIVMIEIIETENDCICSSAEVDDKEYVNDIFYRDIF